MNTKMITNNYQQPNLKQTKQTSRTGTESQKWRSHGAFSVGKGKGGMGGRYREEEA